MKRFFVIAAAMALFVPALAMAQPAQHNKAPGGHRPAGHGHATMPHNRPMNRMRPSHHATRPSHTRMTHRNQFHYHGHYMRRVHGPAFRYPHGWHYRRWTVGVTFPAIFLTPTYFYTGWAGLGLAPPAPGYAWVRFGPDLVLVNLSTHEVENVVYGVFY
jgi:Ni/Co efflux regulator RcnB